MPYLKGNIQDRIKDLREQNGWSKAELAERIGIDASRMGRIEFGETKSIGDDVMTEGYRAQSKLYNMAGSMLMGMDLPGAQPVPIGFPRFPEPVAIQLLIPQFVPGSVNAKSPDFHP